MENLSYGNHNYRMKKLNAIEVMSIGTQMNFDDYDKTKRFYELLLENMEVEIENKWLPVKEKNQNVYWPNGIENDMNALKALTEYCMKYFKEVFPKSNELNSKRK